MNDAGQMGLELSDVTVRFGGLVALDKVRLSVGPGQVVGVIGPNGAGKTTLFNVMCGFVQPDEGRMVWRGTTLRRLRPHQLARHGIARTLQGLGLFPHLTVLENVMIGADRHGRADFFSAAAGLPRSDHDEDQLESRARALLEELGVAGLADRIPAGLPYALQKRVALARALVVEPDLLLLDEPASGLSSEEMRELGDLIRSLKGRMSVCLVEHHMDLVMTVCDQIFVLDFGRLIASGTPEEVRRNPAVLEAYLGRDVEEVAQMGEITVEAGDA